MGKSTISVVMFNSYASLQEGMISLKIKRPVYRNIPKIAQIAIEEYFCD